MENPENVIKPSSSRGIPTASLLNDKQTITITHPFSPHRGQEFIVIERITAWNDDKLICCDNDGNSRTFLTSWTDYPIDEPQLTATISADFKFNDLQMLAKLIGDIKKL